MLQVSLFKKQAYRTIILYIQTDPYKQHDIYLTSDEISSPSVNNFVALLDYNVRDASLLLSLIKNDNSKIDISIPEAAVEIFTGYMMNTVIKAGCS